MTDAGVTVVVPTLARRERAVGLFRAIASVVSQRGVRAVPLVVVNGAHRDPELVRALRADSRLRVLERDAAGLPGALRAGREAVDTECFATLDDDDTLLPGALARRRDALHERPDCDVVVTNGYRRRGDLNVLHVAAGAEVERDPLRALQRGNWLLPGSWLGRSDRVGARLFDGMPPYLECTFLALRFATAHRMRWLPEPTVVYTVNSPLAESGSRAYLLGQADALRALLALELPAHARRWVRACVAHACHAAADAELHAGRTRSAWHWHAATLREPGGWRHLSFARHLLRASWRARAGASSRSGDGRRALRTDA